MAHSLDSMDAEQTCYYKDKNMLFDHACCVGHTATHSPMGDGALNLRRRGRGVHYFCLRQDILASLEERKWDPNFRGISLSQLTKWDDLLGCQTESGCDCWRLSLDLDKSVKESKNVLSREGGPEGFLTAARRSEGLWYSLFQDFCGRSVFRQEPAPEGAVNGDQLFMFFWSDAEDPSMDGFYIASHVSCLTASYKNAAKGIAMRTNKTELVGWSPAEGNEYVVFPKDWAFPCKRSQFCQSLTVQPALEFCSELIDSLQSQLDAKPKLYPSPKAAPVSTGGDSSKARNGVPQEQGEQLKGHYVQKHCLKAGWFERCSALIRLCVEEHPDAKALAEELLADSRHVTKKVAELSRMPFGAKPLRFLMQHALKRSIYIEHVYNNALQWSIYIHSKR